MDSFYSTVGMDIISGNLCERCLKYREKTLVEIKTWGLLLTGHAEAVSEIQIIIIIIIWDK